MMRFIEVENRFHNTLFPERFDEYISEDNAVRNIEAFVNKFGWHEVSFTGVEPSETDRPDYHAATMLKIYVCCSNRIQSTWCKERESHRNVESIWLTGRLMPDFMTIADFRPGNRKAICRACTEFVVCVESLICFQPR